MYQLFAVDYLFSCIMIAINEMTVDDIKFLSSARAFYILSTTSYLYFVGVLELVPIRL